MRIDFSSCLGYDLDTEYHRSTAILALRYTIAWDELVSVRLFDPLIPPRNSRNRPGEDLQVGKRDKEHLAQAMECKFVP